MTEEKNDSNLQGMRRLKRGGICSSPAKEPRKRSPGEEGGPVVRGKGNRLDVKNPSEPRHLFLRRADGNTRSSGVLVKIKMT